MTCLFLGRLWRHYHVFCWELGERESAGFVGFWFWVRCYMFGTSGTKSTILLIDHRRQAVWPFSILFQSLCICHVPTSTGFQSRLRWSRFSSFGQLWVDSPGASPGPGSGKHVSLQDVAETSLVTLVTLVEFGHLANLSWWSFPV